MAFITIQMMNLSISLGVGLIVASFVIQERYEYYPRVKTTGALLESVGVLFMAYGIVNVLSNNVRLVEV